MKNIINIIVCIAVIFGLSSCSKKVAFTANNKMHIEKKNVDLTQVQFYNEDPILLVREIDESQIELAKGLVQFKNGVFIEKIKIKRMTPGILLSEQKDDLHISFEELETQFLKFETRKGMKGPYRLKYERREKGREYVMYDGNEYEVKGETLLFYKRIKSNKVKQKSRVAKGRKVGKYE